MTWDLFDGARTKCPTRTIRGAYPLCALDYGLSPPLSTVSNLIDSTCPGLASPCVKGYDSRGAAKDKPANPGRQPQQLIAETREVAVPARILTRLLLREELGARQISRAAHLLAQKAGHSRAANLVPRRRTAGLVRRTRSPADLTGLRRPRGGNRSRDVATLLARRARRGITMTPKPATSGSVHSKPPGTG